MPDPPLHRGPVLNTNTYVSIGLLVVLIAAAWAVLNAVYGAKSEIINTITQVQRVQEKFDWRLEQVEKRKVENESWNYQDMFKWAVHLQRDNDGTGGSVKIKVPEPEPHKDNSP